MKEIEESHFYLARVFNKEKYFDFLEENYDEEDDDKPLSEFYGSQGENFCDHDFMEIGYREKNETLEDFFKPYSYSEHWSEKVAKAARAKNIEDGTALIFISKSEIDKPQSVINKDFELIYLGVYEYPI